MWWRKIRITLHASYACICASNAMYAKFCGEFLILIIHSLFFGMFIYLLVEAVNGKPE